MLKPVTNENVRIKNRQNGQMLKCNKLVCSNKDSRVWSDVKIYNELVCSNKESTVWFVTYEYARIKIQELGKKWKLSVFFSSYNVFRVSKDELRGTVK